MKSIMTDYLIIGAGVSGISVAKNLNKRDYLLLEKEAEPGGYCRTIHKDEFVWDYAGHFFHFSTPEIKNYFEKQIRQEDIIYVKKYTKIFFKQQFIDYPFQMNIHQLDKQDFIDCLYHLVNRVQKKQYRNFKEMLYGKFGNGITEMFLMPYNEKLYACDLNTLDPNAMGRFFPYADFKDIINNMKNKSHSSYNDVFLYPKKGAFEFIKVLLQEIEKERILLKQNVLKVDLDNKILFSENLIIKYNCLINTASFKSFLKLCNHKGNDILKSNKVLVFNLGFNKKSRYQNIHWIYFPERQYNFYRIGFYDNILNQNKLSLYVEIGFNEEAEIDIEHELKITLENLKKTTIISDQKLIAYHYCIMDPAYIHISSEGQEYVKHTMKYLAKKDVYSIGRYGKWTYCSIEDCILQAIQLCNEIIT